MPTYLALRVHRDFERTQLAPTVRLEEVRISLNPLPTSFEAESAPEALQKALAHYPTFRSCLMVQEESAYVQSLPLLAQCGGIHDPSRPRSPHSGRREHPYRNPRPVHNRRGKPSPGGTETEGTPSN